MKFSERAPGCSDAPMNVPFRVSRRVEFCDTDAAGIAHFSVFFLYMEQSEHELLRQLGLSVVHRDDEGLISWPRVQASCQYEGSVKFEDVLEITVHIDRLGERSVSYAFDFVHDGRRIAAGKTTAVCCRVQPGGGLRSIPIPEWMAGKLREFMQINSEPLNNEQ